jgi:hypothetical protein
MKFKLGDLVKKVSGSQWHGVIVGTYSTELTPEGYAVESDTERGSVQIYPAKALELWNKDENTLATVGNNDSWITNPDRMGGCFTEDELDPNRGWK